MQEHQKKWLLGLASDVEAKYGKNIRNDIYGDIQGVENDHDCIKKWFRQFINGMDKLDDKGFLTSILAERCPCGHAEFEGVIRQNYEESKSLEEFADRLANGNLIEDDVRLEGNTLILTKKPFSKYGKHDHKEPYSTTCHCGLGSHTDKPISDIFCHCCTVGFYGKMFKNALGRDIKVEFRDSVIIGGKGCTAAVYLPEKEI